MADAPAERAGALQALGDRLIASFERVGDFVLLAAETTRTMFRKRPPGLETLRQLEEVAIRSAPISRRASALSR